MTATSSAHHRSVNAPLVIALCVLLGIIFFVVSFYLIRCLRRKPSTELPPPTQSFFTPYWRSSALGGSSANVNSRGDSEWDEESSVKNGPGAAPWLPYGPRPPGPPSDSSQTNYSWRKSVGEGSTHDGGAGSRKVLDLNQSEIALDNRPPTAASVPSPLGGSPLLPPTHVKDTSFFASPNQSVTSIANPSLPTSPDPSNPTDSLLVSSPTDANPTNDTPSKDFFPPGSYRPVNGPQSRQSTGPRIRQQQHDDPNKRLSRQSLYSLASASPSYGGDRRNSIRGPPHKNNMQIVLPEPLASGLASSPVPDLRQSNRRSRADLWADTHVSRSQSPHASGAASDSEGPRRKSFSRRKSGESIESRDSHGELKTSSSPWHKLI